jgi:hypothetical protein
MLNHDHRLGLVVLSTVIESEGLSVTGQLCCLLLMLTPAVDEIRSTGLGCR